MNENLKAEMRRYGRMLAEKYKAQLKIDKTHATGQTYDSISSEVTDTGKGVSIDIIADRTLEAIDTGRPAGRKPAYQDILIWARAKRLRPRDKKSGRFLSPTDLNMKRMAYAIAKGIGENGTIKRFGGGRQGSGIIDFVFSRLRGELEEGMDAAFQKDIENEIESKTKIKWQTKS
jgi:hypothetical protein